MGDLGTLGGTESSAWFRPDAINARGDVVGSSYVPGDATRRAFLWTGGRMTDLGDLAGAGSQAMAVNDRGEVVGWSTAADGTGHAFLWRDGRLTDLGVPEGFTSGQATAVTERGEVIGTASRADGFRAVFRWTVD